VIGGTLKIAGLSSTGTEHGLLVESYDGGYKFTVTGNNGKRHAAVLVDDFYITDIIDYLTEEVSE
jgi:hypothetical protein